MRSIRWVAVTVVGLGFVAAAVAYGVDRGFGSEAGTAGKGDERGVRATFHGFMTGLEENPPVDTVTTGRFKIRFNREVTAADFELRVRDGSAITQAHLHCGPVGVNGPVVAFLFGMVPGGFEANGEIADFTLTDANILALNPDCASRIGFDIRSIADLLTAMEEGNIYVNAHSVANPSGEVRAQLLPGGGANDDDVDED